MIIRFKILKYISNSLQKLILSFFSQTTCIIKYLIEYQYNEEKDIFFDVTSQSTESSTLLKNNLTNILKQAAKNTRYNLS